MVKSKGRVTEMTAKSKMVYGRLLRLGGERGTDSYKIRLFVVKRFSAGPCKITRIEVCHRTITE